MRTSRLLLLPFLIGACAPMQPFERGPYTVRPLAGGVFHIEDANAANPAGVHLDDDGAFAGMNNCSDMYLVVGGERALLVDLSNAVEWDSTAAASLRGIVRDLAGDRDLFVTATHRHGDHLGMLPAFADDPEVRFWVPQAEFAGMDVFPPERTTGFAERASFDLGGGVVIQTLEVPGHTTHSTVFFPSGRNMVFTGDAIGSGSGVWLFDEASFPVYRRSIDALLAYIGDRTSGIDSERLVIHGGHAWQRGDLDRLTVQYVYDMRTLIQRIAAGTAEAEPVSNFIPFLDTNFTYGTATITWNREAAARYAEVVGAQPD